MEASHQAVPLCFIVQYLTFNDIFGKLAKLNMGFNRCPVAFP